MPEGAGRRPASEQFRTSGDGLAGRRRPRAESDHYVRWVTEARKVERRQRRVQETVRKIRGT